MSTVRHTPYPPEQLRDALQLSALDHRNRPGFNEPATTQQRGLIAGMLNKVFKATDDPDKRRLTVLSYIFDRPLVSTRCLAKFEASAFLDYWLRTPPTIREQEALDVLSMARVTEGVE